MTTSIAVSELDKLSMPTASGSGYSRQAYAIEYSPKLARSDGKVVTGVKIDRARELLKPAGCRLPIAAELQKLGELGEKDPAFADYFVENLENALCRELADTGLKRPKGSKDDYTDLRGGRRYWLRIVTEAGNPVGELWVPEEGLVREWSPFGLPSETGSGEHGPAETHFYFSPTLRELFISRYGCRNRPCFHLSANRGPSDVRSFDSFRPVRGFLPNYQKI